ncbi:hypothetical protein [Pseudomonas sp.]|uniref:hypothetical protein n=1 Tax=Pseudomonas sp. TaxID=306 RepID=UPI002582E54F|nr:hypothetical protein [Pseudomonas sp.]
MKYAAMVAALLASTLASGAPLTRMDELNLKCEKEKTSLFRDNNGTPSCDHIARIQRDYEARTAALTADLRKRCNQEQTSLFRDNNGTPSCERLAQALRDRASGPVGDSFHYSPERGKYCYFNEADEPTSCP